MVDTAEELDAARQGFDDLPAAVAVVRGRELRIAAANAAYRGLIGRTDVVGAPLAKADPGLANRELIDLVHRARREGDPVIERELRLAASRSDSADDDAWFDLMLVPQYGDDGRVAGVLIQLTDVTHERAHRRDTDVAAAASDLRYREARNIVLEQQEALLPSALPTLPQLRLGAGYRVAESGQSAGGDWFDATALADGRVALVVGDVVGNGVPASTAMGRLRTIVEDVLVRTGDLSRAVARAEEIAMRSAALRAGTLCAAVLDRIDGVLTYVTCGHPPPLVIAVDGTTRFLPTTGGAPLGGGRLPGLLTTRLGDEETVLLYSDGLIERTGRTLTDGMDALARVARDATLHDPSAGEAEFSLTDRICRLSLEHLTAPNAEDDATLLAAQRVAAPLEGFRARSASTAGALADIRRELGGWLGRLGATPAEQDDLDLALIELVTNVLDHAYGEGADGEVGVRGELGHDGVLRLDVIDQGWWRAPAATDVSGGRGLWIAESLVDEMTIAHGDDTSGTTVTLHRRLWRPAQAMSRPNAVPVGEAELSLELTTTENPPRVTAAGKIDHATVRRFTDQMDSVCRGGLRPLIVDLTSIDLLASAGVRVLLSMRERLARHGHELDLIAAMDSPAQTVLDLVGLPWRSEGRTARHDHPIRPRDPEEGPDNAWPDSP